MSAWGAYVHVPWCGRRCPYCAFYVEVDRGVDWTAFTDALLAELNERRGDYASLAACSTAFFGGGTPSRMPPDQIARVVRALVLAPHAEVSVEANPEDLGPQVLHGLLSAGVNRLSIGLQTLSSQHARTLNRASTVATSRQAIARVASAGFESWSVDLMFALPGQTFEQLAQDVHDVLALNPPHVSLYGLTYEPGTAFERARDRGTFAETDEELWRRMYSHIAQTLHNAGLERYELSNFARPGHESRHNQLYWSDRPYLGLGPSAHGYRPDHTRYHNVRDAQRYQLAPTSGATDERPTPAQAATDLLVSCLRSKQGLCLSLLARRTALRPSDIAVQRLITEGLLHDSRSHLRLTDRGFFVCDAIVAHLGERLEPSV